MIKASIKEFELLKIDIGEIKKQINVYFGFIIGTNGLFISLAFILYQNEKNDSLVNIYFVMSLAIINLMLLYNIIRYKFSSHNKMAGYLRLLSLECNYHQDKRHKHISIENNSNDLYCWEYIMFRNDSLTYYKDFPKKKILKLNFDFEPNNKKQAKKYKLSYEKVRLQFLEKIVFDNKSNYSFLRDFYKIIMICRLFLFNDKYHKYRLTSWKFIENIFNSFLVIYCVLIAGSIFLLFKSCFLHTTDYIFLIIVMTSLPFLYYFFFNVKQLLRHNKSSDFYFWSLLPFRVEYLNKYGIKPIYSSTYLYRYIKNLYYYKILDDTKNDEFILNNSEKVNLDKIKIKLIKGSRFNKKERNFIKKIKIKYKS